MKKIIIRLVLGLFAGLILSGSASAAVQIDTTSIQTTVDKLITKMQQETIKQNFAALLLQNEMRAKMTTERVPQRFMQSSIQPIVQPAMLERIRAQMQAQQMESMATR
ncbi:MAG: hypothetical protein Q3M30_09085 [Candidatus Electrothrix sp. Rat3]|nr:hypothetical protein [Candidatus Electrothrix rattekaaiensis]